MREPAESLILRLLHRLSPFALLLLPCDADSTMAGAGAVSVVDISVLDDPRDLAAAIKNALSTTGFLFVKGHGLEQQAEDMFRISRACFQG